MRRNKAINYMKRDRGMTRHMPDMYTYSDSNRRLDLYCWLSPFGRDWRVRLEEKIQRREVPDCSAVRGRPVARFAAHAEAAAARPPSPAVALRKRKIRFMIRAKTRVTHTD